MEGQTDRHTDFVIVAVSLQTDRWTARQTDRQTDRHANKQIL